MNPDKYRNYIRQKLIGSSYVQKLYLYGPSLSTESVHLLVAILGVSLWGTF